MLRVCIDLPNDDMTTYESSARQIVPYNSGALKVLSPISIFLHNDSLHGAHGHRGKESGIFSEKHNHKRRPNDDDTYNVALPMPGDTEHGQWMLCRALSVWILRSQTLYLCISTILCLRVSVPLLRSLLSLLMSWW